MYQPDTIFDDNIGDDLWKNASLLYPYQDSFPFEIFPEGYSECLNQLARSCAASPNALVGASISIVSGIIGKTLIVKAKESWSERPIFWFGDIKDSGQGKTPPVKHLLEPVWNFQKQEDERVEKANKEEMEKDSKDRILVRGRSYILTDMTTESLREESKSCPTGGIIYHTDELSSVICAQNQYKSGKGTDRESLLKLWSGDSFRIGRTNNSVTVNINLSIFGGIQPFILKKVFGGDKGLYLEDGTVPRFLWCYEPKTLYTLTNESWSETNRNLWNDLIVFAKNFSDQYIDNPMEIRFSDAAFSLFAEWRNDQYGLMNNLPREIASFIPKSAGYVIRLAGIINCLHQFSTGCNPPPVLEETDIMKAISAVEYYQSHAVAAVRIIKDMEPTSRKLQLMNLAKVLKATRHRVDSGKLAIGFVCSEYNKIISSADQMTPKGMGLLIRKAGLNITERLEDANGHRRVHCLIWNDKTDAFTKNVSTSPCLQI